MSESNDVVISDNEIESLGNTVIDELFPELNDEPETVEQEIEKEPEVQPETKVKETPVTNEIQAPEHWSEEMKAGFNALDAKGREALIIQSKNLESGYQKKFQETAKEREKIAAFQGLVDQFQKDKDFAQHILGYTKKDQVADNYGLGERPTDPYQALKWDTAFEAKKVVHEELSQRDEITKQQNYAQEINKTILEAQSDPLYNDVQAGILDYIKSQPESFREYLEKSLDSDVNAYKSTYLMIRNQIEGSKKTTANIPSGVGKEKAPQAPLLESGGTSDDNVVKTKRSLKAEAKAEAIKGNWQPYLSKIVEDLGF